MNKSAACFLSLLGLDIVSKVLALKYIPPMLPKWFGYPYGGLKLFDIAGIQCSLNTVFNTGAAWGMFQGYSGILFILRIAIISGLVVYLLSLQRDSAKPFRFSLSTVPLWCVTIGAIGNCLDYLIYGHVIDFIHFCFWGHSFPVFNIADSYITLGVIGLLLTPRKDPLRSP